MSGSINLSYIPKSRTTHTTQTFQQQQQHLATSTQISSLDRSRSYLVVSFACPAGHNFEIPTAAGRSWSIPLPASNFLGTNCRDCPLPPPCCILVATTVPHRCVIQCIRHLPSPKRCGRVWWVRPRKPPSGGPSRGCPTAKAAAASPPTPNTMTTASGRCHEKMCALLEFLAFQKILITFRSTNNDGGVMMMSTQREEVRLTINRGKRKELSFPLVVADWILLSSRGFFGFLTVLIVLLATNLIPVSLYCPGSVLVSDQDY